jgi:membrane protein YdbS with pleckstrin-like domain
MRFGQNCIADRAQARQKSHLFLLPPVLFNALAATFEDVRALVQKPTDIAGYLIGVRPLQDLSSAARRHLAQFCGWMFVPAGQNITTQGQLGYGLVILRQGEAVVVAVDDRGRPRPRNYLRAQASYGETSLIQGKEHDATVRAVSTPEAADHPRLDGTDIIVLDRRDLNVAFQEDPRMWAGHASLVQRSVQVKEAARPYGWMQDGEKLEWRGRAHWLWLALPESVVALILAALLAVVGLVPPAARDEFAVFTMIVTALILLPAAVFVAYNYFDDYYVVTNRRVTRRDHLLLLYEARTETPLEMVQDVTYDADFWGRLFDYGDVVIRSAARVGAIQFQHVPRPDQVRAIIQFERAEATAGVRGQQHEELRKAVMTGLRLALPIPPVGRALGSADAPPVARNWWARLRGERRPGALPAMKGTLPGPFVRLANRFPERWRRLLIGDAAPALQLKEGEFLWRKHIIQLIIQAGRPFVLLLVWLALGWVLFRTDLGANQTALHLPWWVMLVFFIAWVVWEYADYRNDLYILREDRIIDIEATPLWLSIKRREGNLNRVQNVFARQEGIWQNLLNYGDVEIQTAAIDEGFNFLKVANPQLVQATIFQKLDALRNRQVESLIRERQREIIEGLNVYHELRSEGHNL